VSEDAGIEPRTAATTALAVKTLLPLGYISSSNARKAVGANSRIFAVAQLLLGVYEIPPEFTVQKPQLSFTLHPAYTQKIHSSNRDKITLSRVNSFSPHLLLLPQEKRGGGLPAEVKAFHKSTYYHTKRARAFTLAYKKHELITTTKSMFTVSLC
jgi:hypothetical protein